MMRRDEFIVRGMEKKVRNQNPLQGANCMTTTIEV